jgi:uncharacterized protein (TIGR02421 family)
MKGQRFDINDGFIQKVCSALDKNKPIRCRFTGWGRLHIDRNLPFLCIYQKPHNTCDKGTNELILGQANYILVDEVRANSVVFKKLLQCIADKAEKAFGAFLFLELWSQKYNQPNLNSQTRLQFRIYTETDNAPLNLLEATENALLGINFNGVNPELTLGYGVKSNHNDRTALNIRQQNSPSNWYWMGVALTPVFRVGNKTLPYEIKIIHLGITRAFRQIFYAFIHQYTTHTPKHYHELGKHSMTSVVLQTDKKLAGIKDKFDILFHVTPVNVPEVWAAFRKSHFLKIPVFKYRPRPIDPDGLKRQLYAIKIEQIDDPALTHIFHTQRQEISQLLTMIGDRNSPNFLYGSLQVFGGVSDTLLDEAKNILKGVSIHPSAFLSRKLTAKELANRANELIAKYRIQNADFHYVVEIRDDLPGIMVSGGKLLIGSTVSLHQETVDATLAHEVSTHIVTHFNGSAQAFQQFHSGMQDYESTQEGLAVLAEYFVGNLQPHRLRTLAARVVAVDALVRGADFIQVFRLLTDEWCFSNEQAFHVSMRVFRGGGFTKDAVYLKGLIEVVNYLKCDGDFMLLFVGKIGLQHIPFVKEMKWRNLLKEALITPCYIGSALFESKMTTLRKSDSILSLIKRDTL